jgi:hypothetical protein
VHQLGCVVGNVHYRFGQLLCVCFGKVKGEAGSNQLITFARCFDEALPIEYCHLPAAAFNQTCALELSGSIRYGRPLNTQHFGEKALGDQQSVLVTAVTHHEQPKRQPLPEAAAQPLFASLDDQQKRRFSENLIRINNERDPK